VIDFFFLGQSGYNVKLVENNGRPFVRKECSPTDIPGRNRLELQYQKHVRALSTHQMRPMKIPEIVEPFGNNGYSMSLVPGKPLGIALELMSQKEVQGISNIISLYFVGQIESVAAELVNIKALEKLRQIREVYSNSTDESARVLGLAALEKLRIFFEEIDIQSSPNHGDFSFDNILSDRRGTTLFAIDLLDSPFETILLDIGRFWLDLRVGWWANRSAPKANATINMAFLKRNLVGVLHSNGIEPQIVEYFLALAALRVLPYTEQPYRRALLKNALRRHVEDLT
jgi:hypothetical protein